MVLPNADQVHHVVLKLNNIKDGKAVGITEIVDQLGRQQREEKVFGKTLVRSVLDQLVSSGACESARRGFYRSKQAKTPTPTPTPTNPRRVRAASNPQRSDGQSKLRPKTSRRRSESLSSHDSVSIASMGRRPSYSTAHRASSKSQRRAPSPKSKSRSGTGNDHRKKSVRSIAVGTSTRSPTIKKRTPSPDKHRHQSRKHRSPSPKSSQRERLLLKKRVGSMVKGGKKPTSSNDEIAYEKRRSSMEHARDSRKSGKKPEAQTRTERSTWNVVKAGTKTRRSKSISSTDSEIARDKQRSPREQHRMVSPRKIRKSEKKTAEAQQPPEMPAWTPTPVEN